jgi:lysine 2,3-aminomutase
MPNLSLDIPGGGGKAGLVPNFETAIHGETREYVGWDGKSGTYAAPAIAKIDPLVDDQYAEEWRALKEQPYGAD